MATRAGKSVSLLRSILAHTLYFFRVLALLRFYLSGYASHNSSMFKDSCPNGHDVNDVIGSLSSYYGYGNENVR